jgi:hypothetical protein
LESQFVLTRIVRDAHAATCGRTRDGPSRVDRTYRLCTTKGSVGGVTAQLETGARRQRTVALRDVLVAPRADRHPKILNSGLCTEKGKPYSILRDEQRSADARSFHTRRVSGRHSRNGRC